MPTIKDVAKLAEVSTATVSATINGTAYVILSSRSASSAQFFSLAIPPMESPAA